MFETSSLPFTENDVYVPLEESELVCKGSKWYEPRSDESPYILSSLCRSPKDEISVSLLLSRTSLDLSTNISIGLPEKEGEEDVDRRV